MIKTVGKSLAAKKDRTTEENDMLDMMLHGGERVKAENLSAVLDWYSAVGVRQDQSTCYCYADCKNEKDV